MAAKKKSKQIPSKVKQYWCYGCLQFDIIDWKEGKYHCNYYEKDIKPSEHFDCKNRTVHFLDEDQMSIDDL